MKKCQTCKHDKELDEFGNNKKKPDGKQDYCLLCGREKDKRHYLDPERKRKLREAAYECRRRYAVLILEYLRLHHCVDCGEDDPIVLDFDHCSGKKRDNVTCLLTYSTETVKAEIEKCVVRCANCHRRKTAKEQGHFRYYAGMV